MNQKEENNCKAESLGKETSEKTVGCLGL